jgi:hypothetical protein
VRELGNLIVEASPGVHIIWGVALAILLVTLLMARGGGRSTNSQAPARGLAFGGDPDPAILFTGQKCHAGCDIFFPGSPR